MIECKNGLFHLKNQALSCLLRVNRYGLLEQVHFGAPVGCEDVEALAGQPGLGWGSSLLLNDKDPGSCPDAMALAWSDSGRGDFRESPLEMDGQSTNFTYVNHRLLDALPAIQLDILNNVCRYLKPGGTMLYSTCTVRTVENEEVVKAFLAAHPEFKTEAFTLPGPVGPCEQGMVTLWPHRHGTDGFFICKLRKEE